MYQFIDDQILRNIYHRIMFEKARGTLKLKHLIKNYNIPDPDKIFWIDPEKIVYHTNYHKKGNTDIKDRVFDMKRDKGAVYGGDWDISTYKFSDLDVFKAFKQRIRKKIEWEKTSFYKNKLREIEDGKVLWGCRNKNNWDERCNYLDSLIKCIKDRGYVLAHQIITDELSTTRFLRKEMSEEITVNIGRDGQFFFQNGRHRLSIAKIMNVPKIPVKVLVRHKEWLKSQH